MQSKHNPTCPSLTVPSSSPCSHLSISVLSIHSGPMSSRSCPRASHSPWPKSQSKNGRLTNNSQSNGGTTSPLKILKHLGPQISIAPLGIIKQETIDAMGSLVPKLLMIYDQSFLGPSSLLVNCHVNREALLLCMHGCCLLQMCHYIISLHLCHPTTQIFISKIDIKNACHCAHLSARMALESTTIFDDLLLISLQMTYWGRGSPYPAQWSCISEITCDMMNNLIQCNGWDPATLHSPH